MFFYGKTISTQKAVTLKDVLLICLVKYSCYNWKGILLKHRFLYWQKMWYSYTYRKKLIKNIDFHPITLLIWSNTWPRPCVSEWGLQVYLCSCSLAASSSCSCCSLSLCWRTAALRMSDSLFRAPALFSSSWCRFIWGGSASFKSMPSELYWSLTHWFTV